MPNITGLPKNFDGGAQLTHGQLLLEFYGTDARVDGEDVRLGFKVLEIKDLTDPLTLDAGVYRFTFSTRASSVTANGRPLFATKSFAWDLTADVSWGDIFAANISVPEMTPSLVQQAKTYRDEAETFSATTVALQDDAVTALVSDDASATSAALSATIEAATDPLQVNRVRPNTWASIGDSISARASLSANSSGGSEMDRRSWQQWTNVILGQRFEPVTSYAVAGKTAEQMVTEQLPQVLAMNPLPGYCTLLGGTNSINGGATDTTVIASLKTMIDALVAVNVRPIVGTITPRTGFTATQSGHLVRVNAWLRKYVPTVGGVLVDWFAAMAQTDGSPKTNMLYDGLHPSVVGAVTMAEVAAAALVNVVPASNRLPGSNLDSPSPVMLTNPMMTGTTGTKFDAGALGTVATNYTLRASAGGTYSATGSKIARTDVPGDWQQIALASGEGFQLYQGITDATRWTVGSQVYGLVEFEADADLAGATGVEWLLIALGGTSPQTSRGPYVIAGDTYTGAVAVPTSGVVRIPPITVNTGMTEVRLVVKVVGGTGTLRIGRASVQKV